MARPTKLTPDLLEKARGYLPSCEDVVHRTEKDNLAWVDVNLPSKVGLAIHLGIDKTTVDEWCKIIPETFNPIVNFLPNVDGSSEEEKNKKFDEVVEQKSLRKEFSSIVADIMKEQEKRLINNGLGGLYKEKTNAMLLSKHGYVTEKTETDITTQGEKIQSGILPQVIAEADRLLKERKLS